MKLLTDTQLIDNFGHIKYRDNPDGSINITNADFITKLCSVTLPVADKFLYWRCHIKIIHQLENIFDTIKREKFGEFIIYEDTRKNGGCFVARHSCWNKNKPISRHSWGIAVDINPNTNLYGKKPTIRPEIVSIFEEYGFAWGGRWKTPDGMHFEYSKIT